MKYSTNFKCVKSKSAEWNQQKYGEEHELRKKELRHVIFVQILDIYTLSVVNQAQKNFITNLLHLVPRRV